MDNTSVHISAKSSVSSRELQNSVYKSKKLNETKNHSILNTDSEITPPKVVAYSSIYDYDERRLLNKRSQGRYYNLCPVKSMKVEITNKPFVHIPVEEVSLVTSLENWANRNVRVHGKFITADGSCFLESTGKSKSKIELDVSLLEKQITCNSIVQVFGELVVDNGPKVQAMFFRNFEKMDLTKLNNVIEKMRPYVPLFVNRCKKKGGSLNDTIADWDLNSQDTPIDAFFM